MEANLNKLPTSGTDYFSECSEILTCMHVGIRSSSKHVKASLDSQCLDCRIASAELELPGKRVLMINGAKRCVCDVMQWL